MVFQLTLMGTTGPDKPMAPLMSAFPIMKRIAARKVHYFMDSRIFGDGVENDNADNQVQSKHEC